MSGRRAEKPRPEAHDSHAIESATRTPRGNEINVVTAKKTAQMPQRNLLRLGQPITPWPRNHNRNIRPWRIHHPKKIPHADSVLPNQRPLEIARADPINPQWPADADCGIIVSQTCLAPGPVGAIHEVKKVRLVGERLMPVRHSIGNAQRKSIDFAQFERKMMMPRRRIQPHVDDHIPNRSANAAHDFAFMNAGLLIMHAANRAHSTTSGQVPLRHMKGKTELAKLSLAKCP